MSIGNASGFLLSGLILWLLPTLAPELFPRTGIDGSSARAMWVQVMALVNGTLGALFLFRQEIFPRFTRWLATQPAQLLQWRREPVPVNAVAIEAIVSTIAIPETIDFPETDSLAAVEAAPGLTGQYAALWRAVRVAFRDEKRFERFIARVRAMASHDRRGHQAFGAGTSFGQDVEDALVRLIQSSGLNLDLLERRSRDWFGKVTPGAFLRQTADELSEIVSGDMRRAA